jgi:murein DD-endopeptidase MepM/ murein hydrolase activator NlpD
MTNPFDEYYITSPYGPRTSPITGKPEKHTGIDLVKKKGGPNAPIEAFVPGTVIRAEEVPDGVKGTGYGGFGLVVAIKDKYGVQHMYAHLSRAAVKVGDHVAQGQVIGCQGCTGKSTGPHLHYEVRLKTSPSGGFGSDTEPTKYLQDYFAKETPAMTLDQALQILANAGVINSPDYWKKNAVKDGRVQGDYAAALIIRAAAKLKGAK